MSDAGVGKNVIRLDVKKLVAALRRCDEQECVGCPYDGICSTPGSEFQVERDAADVIERMGMELERLTRENEKLREGFRLIRGMVDGLDRL